MKEGSRWWWKVILCAALLLAVCALVLRLAARQGCRVTHTGSRYVSWLPSFSVEVTRVRAPPPHRLEAMAAQVQQMFPQYALGALAADLARTRSADLTANNILEGRLPPPPTPPPAPPAEPPASAPTHPAPLTTDADTDTAADLAGLLSPAPFPASAREREAALRRRRHALLAAARDRYTRQHAHTHTHTHSA